MIPASPRLPRLLGWGTVLVTLAFAAFTDHIWEDYFITFRSSLNLATGHGLVYQHGERVHSFTSTLGTLLPALFAVGGGDSAIPRALWLYRIASAVALGLAVWLFVRKAQRDSVAPLALVAAAVAWALDAKTVDFAINGMEVGLLVLFIAVTWHALTEGARVLPLAVGCAGLQWTRPDGCVFFGALALAWLVFGRTGTEPWRPRLVAVVRGTALGLVAYLPWVVIAWLYFGSPVPHTIMAKASHHPPGELALALLLYPWRLIAGGAGLHDVFLPTYHFFGGWPSGMSWLARLLAVGAALAWVWPRVQSAGRVASAAFFLGGFYLEYIPRSPWYFPGWLALAWIAWGYLLDAALKTKPATAPGESFTTSAARIGAALLIATQAALLVCAAQQMRTQQAIIEDGHRREIGRWLRAEARPGDRVFLECLGYLGFFSGLKMLDYPGLCSPEVVAARRAGHRSFGAIIAALQPEWVVLRPPDAAQAFAAAPQLRTAYRLVREFNVRPQIDAVALLPGRGYLNFDAVFLVFRKEPAERPRP